MGNLKKLHQLSDNALKIKRVIWRKTLKDFKRRILLYGDDPDVSLGICSSIGSALSSTRDAPTCMASELPEFRKYKPNSCWKQNDAWWWNPGKSRNKRIKTIEFVLADVLAEIERRKKNK